ncbi:MAG: RNA polymerase sigma factor [Nitrospirota bacterium]
MLQNSIIETFCSVVCLFFGIVLSKENDWEEDADLVRQTKSGDPEAYGRLYEKHSDAVYRYCFILLSRLDEPQDDAKEAMSKAFKNCYEQIYSLREESKFFWWIRKTAYNICMSVLKSRADIVRIVEEYDEDCSAAPNRGITINNISSTGSDPLTALLNKETRAILKEALNSLKEKYRLAVIHRFYMGYSEKETAAIMECTLNNIKTLTRRGLLQLRDILKPYREQVL